MVIKVAILWDIQLCSPYEPTFRRKFSLQSSGLDVSQAGKQHLACDQAGTQQVQNTAAYACPQFQDVNLLHCGADTDLYCVMFGRLSNVRDMDVKGSPPPPPPLLTHGMRRVF
jgi:hypothetical protein